MADQQSKIESEIRLPRRSPLQDLPKRSNAAFAFSLTSEATVKNGGDQIRDLITLQIFFERACFSLGFERNGRFYSPWAVFRCVCTRSSVVGKQSFFKVARNARIAGGFVCLADQDINVVEVFICWRAKP
jgi:hypothetical protein